jgi:hypothetical protein
MIMYNDGRWEEARDALAPIADAAREYKADTIDMSFLYNSNVYRALQVSIYFSLLLAT